MSKDLNAPKISVIIPVYKVEPYLCRCVDSVLAQTYKNLEIILVDDGSPDNCGAICDEYAKKDSRIRVIHKENGGLSDARNAGLSVCCGDYIAFVDSDDWIEPAMYEKLLQNMQFFDADMSIGGVADETEENGTIRTTKVSFYGENPFAESNTDAMKRYFLGSWAAWDKLYKADLFDDVRYPVGEINEDEAIVLLLLEQCKTVCYTNEVFYHYIKRPASITTSSFSHKKLIWAKHCRDNLAWIREKRPELIPFAAARYRGSLLWSLTEIALSDGDFADAEKDLLAELRKNKKLFFAASFDFASDKIRLLILSYLPLGAYRAFVKALRRIKHEA